MNIDNIRNLNKNLIIRTADDKRFKEYGKLLSAMNYSTLIKYAEENIQIPKHGNVYSASEEEIEKFEVIDKIRDNVYGKLHIEAGSCAGQNTKLTGVEYHQGSEVVIAVTDCILIVGKIQDMKDNTYDSSKTEIFYLKKGEAVELYGTTLHYTPCKVNENGFITIVILIKGTNSKIEKMKDSILTKKNKYFITHSSQLEKVKNGAYPGLIGEIITVKVK